MAKSVVGADLISEILSSLSIAKKEFIVKKDSLAKTYDNLLATLSEYINTKEKKGKINKRIERLRKQLQDAQDAENEVLANSIQKDIEQLEAMEKNIKKTIDELGNIKIDSCEPKDLHCVLSKRMWEIYQEQTLCPYCHGLNPDCGFFNGLEEEEIEKIYEPPEKGGYRGQDRDGKNFLNTVKNNLKGKTIKIPIKNKNGVSEECEFDLGENMSIQYHHLNSFVPYKETSTISIAGNRHEFNINKNSAAKNKKNANQNNDNKINCGLNNIIALPSINVNQGPNKEGIYGIKIKRKDNSVDFFPWSALDTEIKIQIIEAYLNELNETINIEGNKPEVYRGVFLPPVHLGNHEDELISAEDFFRNAKDIIEEDDNYKNSLYSYEECAYYKNAGFEEEIFNTIKAKKYLCSNIENAGESYAEKMNEIIETLRQEYLQYVNAISSKIIDKLKRGIN